MSIDDPFKVTLAEVPPPKSSSRRAKRRATAPGSAPEDADDMDLELSFLPLHDLGNAQRLLKRFGRDLIYVDRNGWYVWDGIRWAGGDDGEFGARLKAQQIAEMIVKEAKALEKAIIEDAKIGSQDRVDKLLQWSSQSGNSARISAILKEAHPFLRKKITDLDTHKNLLPCRNGTLVLGQKTIFRENRREDFMTRAVTVEYDPRAVAPDFGKFICRIMPDEDAREFLKRTCGYMLTGFTSEHKMFMWYGLGRNGKTTLAQSMRNILGEYSAGMPVATLLRSGKDQNGSEAEPAIARLPGVRMVNADEPPEGAKLDEGKIKKLTGGDGIETRHLFDKMFEFHPAFKMVLLANYKPAIYGVDEGIWSRMFVIAFTVRIPDSEIDRSLDKKLKAEAQGILNWMIEGAEEWFAGGLNAPASVTAANDEYRADQNPVGQFIKSKCDDNVYPGTEYKRADGKPYETTAKALRDAYEEWCKEEGSEAMSSKAFGSKLQGMGYDRRRSNGHVFYQNIWLKSADPTKAQEGQS